MSRVWLRHIPRQLPGSYRFSKFFPHLTGIALRAKPLSS